MFFCALWMKYLCLVKLKKKKIIIKVVYSKNKNTFWASLSAAPVAAHKNIPVSTGLHSSDHPDCLNIDLTAVGKLLVPKTQNWMFVTFEVLKAATPTVETNITAGVKLVHR